MITDAFKQLLGEDAPLIITQIIGVSFLVIVSLFLAVFA